MKVKHFGLVTSVGKHSVKGNCYRSCYSVDLLTVHCTQKQNIQLLLALPHSRRQMPGDEP